MSVKTLNTDLTNKLNRNDIIKFNGILDNTSTLQIFNLPTILSGKIPYLLSAQIQLNKDVWSDMRTLSKFIQINVNDKQLLVAKDSPASYSGFQVRFTCLLDQ
ncbi:MAG: hypothetical protein RSC65_01990 [Malacoplasma sp.]